MRHLILLFMLFVLVAAQDPIITVINGETYFAFTREQTEKIAVTMRENKFYVKMDSLYKELSTADSLIIVGLEAIVIEKSKIINEKDDIIELTRELYEPEWYEKPIVVVPATVVTIWFVSMIFSNFSK